MAFKRNCLGTSASWATQGKQGKRLTFVSSSSSVQATHKQFLPRDGFRHVATSSVSSHPTWQRRDLQAMKQHVKGESNAWKATFGRYRRACDPNSFGNTNVSPALLGRWRLLLERGGSALVSKKGMLVGQMLKHQNLADSVRQYCGAEGQGFPVAALRPALGDRRSLSAFFWVAARAMVVSVRLVWGAHPSGAKVHVQ